jgi:hypothetical protein
MSNNAEYISLILDLKKEILEKDSINKKKAEKYIKDLDDFNETLNEDDRLGLNGQIEIMKVYLNLIIKLDKENGKIRAIDKKIKKQQKLLDKNNRKINNHDKRILEMMGTFLTIFSILGMNVLTIPNIKDNIVQNIIIINATILLTMSGLFFLIRFEFSCEKIVLFLVPIILAGVMIFFATINIKDKNEEIESRIETVIKENKTLKQEIEILKRTK